jgi:putative transposase
MVSLQAKHHAVEVLRQVHGLAVRRRSRKRIGPFERQPLPRPTAANQSGPMDFIADGLADYRGRSSSITVDHGPEFESRVLDAWAYLRGVRLAFIRPGKPIENAYVESFNGRFRDECLNEPWFVNIAQARTVIETERIEYNAERPHSSLGNQTPQQNAGQAATGLPLSADSNSIQY